MKIKTTISPILVTGPTNLDVKASVGPGRVFTSMEDFLDRCPTTALVDPMLIQDTNFSVTWQLYKEGDEWKYRLHQGMFYIDAVEINNIVNISIKDTSHTVDGDLYEEGANILVVGQSFASENGIWKVHEGTSWERHPIFNDNFDDLVGLTIKIKQGNVFKNSMWHLVNYGDIEIGITDVYFDQIRDIPNTREIVTTSTGTHNAFALTSYDKNIRVNATLNPAIITAYTTLFVGKEYYITKDDLTDNPVVVVDGATGGLKKYIGTLNKRGDWIKFIPTTDGSYTNYSYWSVSKTDNLTTYIKTITSHDNIYISKEEVYVMCSVSSSGSSNVYLPSDAYPNFSYCIHNTYSGIIDVYDYDGNLLAENISTGSAAFCNIGDQKYLAKHLSLIENSTLLIKIDTGWKLKDIVIENPEEEVSTQATGIITVTSLPSENETLTIGDETFTFKMSATNPFEIKIESANLQQTTEIKNTINADSTYVSADNYGSYTVLKVTAKEAYPGDAGNSIVFTELATGVAFSGSGTLENGSTLGNNEVTINIGTTAEGDDIVSSQTISTESLTTININKILSVSEEKELFISSVDWNYAKINLYITRDEGISNNI